jgi:hypothetical protein
MAVRLSGSDVGRWVVVLWEDVGRRDAILIGLNPARVLEPFSEQYDDVEAAQVIEKGRYFTYKADA